MWKELETLGDTLQGLRAKVAEAFLGLVGWVMSIMQRATSLIPQQNVEYSLADSFQL